MITNIEIYNKFQRELLQKERFTYEQSLQIYEALLAEAIAVGAITKDNIMEGIEIDINIAKTLNSKR